MGAGRGINRRVKAINNANIILGERTKPKFNLGDFVSSNAHGEHKSNLLILRIIYNKESGVYQYRVYSMRNRDRKRNRFGTLCDENEIMLVKSAASQGSENYRDYFVKPVTFQYRSDMWDDIQTDFDIRQLDGQQAYIVNAWGYKVRKKTGDTYSWLNKIDELVFFKLHFNKYDVNKNRIIQKICFSAKDLGPVLPVLPTLGAEVLDNMSPF